MRLKWKAPAKWIQKCRRTQLLIACLVSFAIILDCTDSIAQQQKQSDRFERGSKLIGEVYGDPEAGRKLIEGLSDIAPDMGRFIIEFPYGDIYSRPGLDMKSREIATVAALTGLHLVAATVMIPSLARGLRAATSR